MSWKTPQRRHRILRKIPAFLRTPIVLLFRAAILLSIVVLAVGGFYYYLALDYDLDKVEQIPASNLILDCHGEELGTVGSSHRRLVTREEIPQHLVEALLAREDARFYDHGGVDYKGLARATVRNIKDRSYTQGASTLSMQLTRNSFEIRAKSLHRKALEIALTKRVEARYSKDEILTHYLNRIYFGSGCHGIEEAAQTYFNKTTAELNLAESAMLAGIIRGPHIFSPLRDLDAATEQRDQTLERMLVTNKITQSQAHKAKQYKHQLATSSPHNAPSYALSSIQRHLKVILESQDIRQDGLKIHTTIDKQLNAQWHDLINQQLKEFPHIQIASVILEPHSGAMRAVIGGRDYKKSPYNRAFDSRRDLGSSITPFIYLAALERNRLPLSGQPVQSGRQIGVKECARMLQRFGLKSPFVESEDLFRGATTASALHCATAAATLSANGQRPHSYLIEKITDSDDNVLFKKDLESSPAAEPGNCQQALQMLEKTPEGRKHTGTSSRKRDAWLLSFDQNTSTALWLGYDKAKPLPPKVLKRLQALPSPEKLP